MSFPFAFFRRRSWISREFRTSRAPIGHEIEFGEEFNSNVVAVAIIGSDIVADILLCGE
jgi:hypothetical protein